MFRTPNGLSLDSRTVVAPSRPALRALRSAIAPFLILAAPFAAYLQHHRYSIFQPEALLFLAALAGVAVLFAVVASPSRIAESVVLAALLTFFVDIQAADLGVKTLGLIVTAMAAVLWLLQAHAARLVGVAMATMCVVALVPQASAPERPMASPGNRDLPLVVHVVLDEHIGVAGIPTGLVTAGVARDLEHALVGRGFRLFGAAYSEFPETKWSLPHMFNLVSGEYRDDLARPGVAEGTFQMTRNEYFTRMAKAGYAIRVYQAEYLDVCAGAVAPAACLTYRARTLDALQHVSTSAFDKLRALGGSYLLRSELYRRTRQQYRDARRRLRTSWRVPAWNWERDSTAPLASLSMFDVVAADLKSASRGEMVFAHFLVPHYPYVYDAQCRPRPLGDWMERSSDARVDLVKGAINTPESRAARYRLYLEQLACTRAQFTRLIEAIPSSLRADAVIIVHGDHGSRISLTDPVTTVEDRLLPSDYADSYSTLFAVRAPGIAAGYEEQPRAISCLLTALVDSGLRALDTTGRCGSDGTVFFRHDSAPRARPLRAFWQPAPPPAPQVVTLVDVESAAH